MAEPVTALRSSILTSLEKSGLADTASGTPTKHKVFFWLVPLLLIAGLIAGCGDSGGDVSKTNSESASASTSGSVVADESTMQSQRSGASARWYASENVSRGGTLFAQHCAACHGKGGEGAFTWRQLGSDGKYPPPPLNGTGHAWHHPIGVLGGQIKFGAPGGQGNMPPFGDRLSDEDIVDVIAWFQDRWSDEIYAQWLQIELRSRQ